jgi:2-polyprenyl-3-methyl-5-hydroxy-6-metoxy-1,4-benzoquinol methylase
VSPAAGSAVAAARCRLCGAGLQCVFCDLGMSPIANNYLSAEQIRQMELFYPLRALVCEECLLVQVEEFETPTEIFSDYAYFSSYSTTWIEHARGYVDMAIERFGLGASSRVVEVASNDGYLLRHFAERGVPVLGVEPAANVAAVANQQGISTVVEFFGAEMAERLAADGRADLVVGNNVLAHVPDLNDFVAGLATVLAPGGTITIEVPHLLRLIEERQFDTIYHEHFSYFSLTTVVRVFARHGLEVFDVEELATHGGSLRLYACHAAENRACSDRVVELREREQRAGLLDLETYSRFAAAVAEEKRAILALLIDLKRQGKTIVGYGAPAKGNTLLNFCGIGTDFLEYTVDRNPAKQGCYLPGSHVPIRPPEAIAESRPDVVLILPWNLREEIMRQLAYVRDWGCVFAARAPELRLFE